MGRAHARPCVCTHSCERALVFGRGICLAHIDRYHASVAHIDRYRCTYLASLAHTDRYHASLLRSVRCLST